LNLVNPSSSAQPVLHINASVVQRWRSSQWWHW